MIRTLNLSEMLAALSLYFPAGWVKAALVLALFSNCVVIGIFAYLNHYTKKNYFHLWTVAWMFQAVWLAASIGLEESPSAPYLIMARRACIGISALFMFWGSFQLTNQARSQRELGLGVILAVLWSWVAAFHVCDHLWITLPVFVMLATASLYTGRLYFRYRHRYRGAELLSAGFFLWGLHLLGFPFERVMPPAFMVGGYFVSAILSLFIAMGMIVQVLEQARERTETLEQEITGSEEKYRVLFESSSEAIFLVDLETLEILEANQSAQQLLGISSKDLIGKMFSDLSPQLQSQTRVLQDGSLIERKTRLLDMFVSCREFQIVRSDGVSITCEGDASFVQCQKQPVLQINLREITERKKMEQQLRQSEKLSALGQLVAGVAHELNNPLAVVMGSAQILANSRELSEKSRNDMTRIILESDRAAKIVRNLLSFARMREPDLGVIDLNRLMGDVLKRHESQLMAGRIQVEKHLAPHLPATQADAGQIEQVLTNLLNNAIQAVGSRAEPRTISVYTEENGPWIRMAFADNGTGIRSDMLNKIFDPFFTTQPPGKGPGLGLSICHSIVQAHRGRIWAQSEFGQGATFFIELPILELPETNSEAVPAEPSAVLPSPQTHYRLLIVDDEPGIVEVLKEVLGGNGYLIDTASNGDEALQHIGTHRYDLILSDLSMPEMSGDKLYDTLQSTQPDTAQRIIFVTGDTVSPKARAFLDRVGNPWLSKPFNLSEIERRVGAFLQEHPLRSGVTLTTAQ